MRIRSSCVCRYKIKKARMCSRNKDAVCSLSTVFLESSSCMARYRKL